VDGTTCKPRSATLAPTRARSSQSEAEGQMTTETQRPVKWHRSHALEGARCEPDAASDKISPLTAATDPTVSSETGPGDAFGMRTVAVFP